MSDIEHPMPEREGSQTDQRRRALLKGAAWVAPAIVTLPSGSAWAASLTCYENKVQNYGAKRVYTQTDAKKFIKEFSFACYCSGGPLDVPGCTSDSCNDDEPDSPSYPGGGGGGHHGGRGKG